MWTDGPSSAVRLSSIHCHCSLRLNLSPEPEDWGGGHEVLQPTVNRGLTASGDPAVSDSQVSFAVASAWRAIQEDDDIHDEVAQEDSAGSNGQEGFAVTPAWNAFQEDEVAHDSTAQGDSAVCNLFDGVAPPSAWERNTFQVHWHVPVQENDVVDGVTAQEKPAAVSSQENIAASSASHAFDDDDLYSVSPRLSPQVELAQQEAVFPFGAAGSPANAAGPVLSPVSEDFELISFDAAASSANAARSTVLASVFEGYQLALFDDLPAGQPNPSASGDIDLVSYDNEVPAGSVTPASQSVASVQRTDLLD